ncbi:MAG: helix-hairpin-helix domain-containing protein [Cytophagaceae bacterium]|nr:helix-hairpin-helix domain-containing protein [Gemmatimonadaceae bacterium]
MTARRAPRSVARLEDLPNVGPATAGDLRSLGITRPSQLVGRDPYALYDQLCARTGVRQDPCVYDVFISVVRYMEGAPARAWWHYTPERKRTLARRPG